MSKRIKLIILSLIIVFIGIGALEIYVNSILKKVIYEEVKSLSKNNYKLHIDKIKVRLLTLNASVHGFDLKHIPNKADSAIPYSNIKARSIELKGINLIKLLFSHSLNLNTFELIDPKIDLYYNSKYADSLSTKAAVDLFTVQIKKLQLTNVVIHLYSIGKSVTSVNAKNLDYDIKTLNLEINDLWVDQKSHDSSQLHFALNTGNVDGFYLNELFNKRTFHYEKIRFDKMSINISQNKNTEDKLAEKTKTVKTLSQNKFFTAIKPLSIKQLRFTQTNGRKKIVFNGNDLSYTNRDFIIKSFNLDLDQNFKTQIVSKQLVIKGMDADSINDGYNIAVKLLELKEPKIKLVLQNQDNNQDSGLSILKLFSIRRVNSLAIKRGDIEITHKENKYMKAIAKNIELRTKNVLPGNGFIYFDNAAFSATDMFFNMTDNLYNFKLARMTYSQKSGNALMTNLKLAPNHSKKSFGKIQAKQIVRVTLGVKTIDLLNINILHILNKQTFTCDKVVVNSMNAEFYKDKNIPLLATDYRKFPQEILRELGFGLNITTLELKNSYMSSEVLSPFAYTSGSIGVDQVNVLIKGINNTPNSSSVVEVTFRGRLANTGLINATATMPVNDLLCNHTATIEINRMPFQKLNTYINDVAHVSISRGELDKAIILIKGNKKEMNCKLQLQYHDLVMKILEDESTSRNANKLNLATKIANSFIYNSNPEKGKPLRVSQAKIPTKLNKFIINNWIEVTLHCMLETTAPNAVKLIQKGIKTSKKILK